MPLSIEQIQSPFRATMQTDRREEVARARRQLQLLRARFIHRIQTGNTPECQLQRVAHDRPDGAPKKQRRQRRTSCAPEVTTNFQWFFLVLRR
ncbi:hypothetical protein D3C78_1233490 [compost metagenome]